MKKNCLICGGKVIRNNDYSFKCLDCNFYFSNLKPGFGQDVEGIEGLRKKNFKKILKIIHKKNKRPRILEIGSGDGFFIDECIKFKVFIVGSEACDDNLERLKKKFSNKIKFIKLILPESIKTKVKDKFDFVIFNDVFEHISNPDEVIVELKKILKENGSIIINLPSSNGIIFKTSEILMKYGFSRFYDRLWQKNMNSPHISYFNISNLNKLFFKHDFVNIQSGYLDTIEYNNYHRIKNLYDSKPFIIVLSIVCFFLAIFQKFLPKDIIFGLYKINCDK